MIVQGTTIGLMLIPGYVEIRDKGLVKKKVPTKNRSFDEILEDVELFFKARRKILAPGILKGVLLKIGVPQVKKIVDEEDLESAVEEDEIEKTETADLETPSMTETPSRKESHISETEKDQETEEVVVKTSAHQVSVQAHSDGSSGKSSSSIAAAFIKSPEVSFEEKKKPIIGDMEFDDVAEALAAVEALSDEFIAEPIEVKKDEKQKIAIRVEGSEEVTAATSAVASQPVILDDEEVQETKVDISLPEVSLGTSRAKPKVVSSEADIEEEPEKVSVDIPAVEIEGSTAKGKVSPTEEEKSTVLPDHAIKPIVEAKTLILGEEDVGKQSLQKKAEMEPVPVSGNGTKAPYVQQKMYTVPTHRVNLQIWSFDEAVKAKVSRSQFYASPDVLIIVYSTSDRWSFDSVEFWLKEATTTCDYVPPVVIVGNKIDERGEVSVDTGDDPVSHKEGFALADQLAQKFANGNKLHPVAFIECSCLTGEGVEEVFQTAAELFAQNL
ncbi:MAG: hypothetical protein GF411_13645 [Candidatus Lokiarchaeota archaeon]|nr:hypothetical protein [Candidatus Lokiarchaeota archaeon]